MDLLTEALRAALLANAAASAARDDRHDPVPVVKFFSPLGAATWLATELYDDGDTLFGLADLGFGCPELGCFSLSELTGIRLPFGLGIERDLGFASAVPLSIWADFARHAGSILGAQHLLRPVEAHRRASASRTGRDAAAEPDPLPLSDPESG